jgi:hypothetical protein
MMQLVWMLNVPAGRRRVPVANPRRLTAAIPAEKSAAHWPAALKARAAA